MNDTLALVQITIRATNLTYRLTAPIRPDPDSRRREGLEGNVTSSSGISQFTPVHCHPLKPRTVSGSQFGSRVARAPQHDPEPEPGPEPEPEPEPVRLPKSL